MLISLREFARRNGVSAVAISKAVKAGRLPVVDGKINPDEAQPIWDQIHRAKRQEGVNQPVNQAPQVNTEVYTPRADPGVNRPVNFGRQVYTAANRRPRVAVAIPLNGAEEMRLAREAADLGVTLQSFILSQCGLELWRLGVPARPVQRREVRKALERRSVTMLLAADDHATLRAQAREAGLSLPQHVRTRCGLPVRHTSMPGTEERDREEDQAWEILRHSGLDPEGYF